MMKHVVVVLTEPNEGREDEFNDYYENLHLDEVLQSTGWSSAQRFKLVDEQGRACPLPYLALYEVETDDSKDVFGNTERHAQSARAKRLPQQADRRRLGICRNRAGTHALRLRDIHK